MGENTQSEEVLRRWWLYVLKLEDNKYYVGITTKTPEMRMQEHRLQKRGAYWTMKHKPLKVHQSEDLGYTTMEEAERLENKMTRYLMKKYGLNNVRGGDLKGTEYYIKRFGYLYDRDLWTLLMSMIFFMLLSIYLLIDKFYL